MLRRLGYWQPVLDDRHAGVTPSDIVRAWRGLAVLSQARADEADRDAVEAEFRRRLADFGRPGSPVVRHYLCHGFLGGCFLTAPEIDGVEGRKLWFVLDTLSVELAGLQQRAAALQDEVVASFGGRSGTSRHLTALSDAIFDASTWVLYAADMHADTLAAGTAGDPLVERQIQIAAGRVAHVETLVATQIVRESRFRYIRGALVGLGAALALAGLVGLVTAAWWSTVVSTQALVAGIAFGALGALASITQRLLRGTIHLDFRASRRQQHVIGTTRPVFGALVGMFSALAFSSGLLGPLTAGGAAFGVLASLAFLSGFSERFATETLDGAEELLVAARAKRGRAAGSTTTEEALSETSTPSHHP